MPPAIQVFLAFGAYAALHSLLLTRWARLVLEALLGPRAFRGLFRLGYVAQAVVLLIALVVYVASLPDAELVKFEGFAGWLLWAVRLGSLAFIVRCAIGLDVPAFLGMTHFTAWRRGEDPPGDGVETGDLVISGPYRQVRHPMYAAAFFVIWAEPHWTWNRLAFSVAASCYLWLGTLHEERRLLRTYGDPYRRYLARTPRYIPRLPGTSRERDDRGHPMIARL